MTNMTKMDFLSCHLPKGPMAEMICSFMSADSCEVMLRVLPRPKAAFPSSGPLTLVSSASRKWFISILGRVLNVLLYECEETSTTVELIHATDNEEQVVALMRAFLWVSFQYKPAMYTLKPRTVL